MHLVSANVACLICSVALAVPTTSPSPPTKVDSLPNPIGTLYPNSVTGTINGTIAVVPIPYALAREIIPSQYGILKKAYKFALPGLPHNMYPLIVRSILDHDVGINGTQLIPDFQSVHIFYPFVDLLGDGYSSFVYGKYLILTGTNTAAIEGSEAYGQIVIPSTFKPENNSYAFSHHHHSPKKGEVFLNAYSNESDSAVVKTKFTPLPSVGPWPLDFYVNVTNQPIFADGVKCDQQITLFNTTLSKGAYAPVGLKGDISISAPYLPSDSTFKNVFGLKVDVAFIENNFLECQSLQGL
ncbi:hypothetical protein V496_04027 [Pseudogymnoascus sp. VKM F-4515 (FW-2607)]|nr:hypothetical protein V496_04027 [Pseudogymnoascus sp. VKM F-4515 (FW-2607)]KFY82936.1 hypothetical protein V498_08387 [Pseudogymnoascus sp. VKM F-4517 (FW-2822)]